MPSVRARVVTVLVLVSLYGFAVGCYQGIAITQSALILGLVAWFIGSRAVGGPADAAGAPDRGRWVTPRFLDLAFVLWVGSGILSTVFAVDVPASLDKLRKEFVIGTVYLFAFHLGSPGRIERVMGVLLLSATAASGVGIADYLTHPFGVEGRTRATLGHYMTMGGLLMISAALAAAWALFSNWRGWRRVAVAVAALANTACLAVTFTRSAWIGFVVALTTVLLLRRRVAVVILVVFLVLFYAFGPPGFQSRIASIFDPGHPANVERLYMWRAGIEIFRDHPVVGVGLMDQTRLYEAYRSPDARERHGHFHNCLIQVAAARGVVGLAAFLFLLSAMGVVLWRGYRAAVTVSASLRGLAAGAFGAYLGFLAAGLFEWNFGDAEVIMLVYFLVGVAAAIARLGTEPWPTSGAR